MAATDAEAHHYLGFRPIVGQSLWYVATLQDQWVVLLGRPSSAVRATLLDRLDALASTALPASDCQQCAFSAPAGMAPPELGLPDFSPQRETAQPGLGTLRWASHPARRNLRGCSALSGDLLSRRRLASPRHDAGLRQAGPGLWGPWSAQAGVGSSAASSSPAAFDGFFFASLELPQKGDDADNRCELPASGRRRRIGGFVANAGGPAQAGHRAQPSNRRADQDSSQDGREVPVGEAV